MFIISTFEHNMHLELAINSIEKTGVPKDKILGVPLNLDSQKEGILDSIHYSDGVSLLDGGAVLGMIFMLLGAIYGYILAWGPIIWGLIGLLSGFLIGLALDLLKSKKKKRRRIGSTAEVVIIVQCEEKELDSIESILWENHALGVGRVMSV